MKPVRFLGDSLKCLRDFPEDARQDAGYQIDKVQRGQQPDDFKPMPSIGKGVEEIRVRDDSGIFRVIYTARLAEAVFVLPPCLPEKDADDGEARYRSREGAVRRIDGRSQVSEIESYDSVWDAIADTPGQAANLRARAELMQQIAAIVEESGWTQAQAAKRCGVTQPRINDLLRGRVSRFSLDALVNIAAAIGRRVRVDLEAA
jgi:predicted XRE-type DNA-binding protein/putative component of toxin-antitoxin plasmid stabilization module